LFLAPALERRFVGNLAQYLIDLVLGLLVLWLLLELLMRVYLDIPLKTSFYGSITRGDVRRQQEQVGLRACSGFGWVHLGWIADIDHEKYRIEKWLDGAWKQVGSVKFGSFLAKSVEEKGSPSGRYRVWAEPKKMGDARLVGEITIDCPTENPSVYTPRIAGTWKPVFKPENCGFYINDHTIFRDLTGSWRLLGITSKTNGNYNAEKYFACGASPDFPPEKGMQESDPIADFNELAWAPHVVSQKEGYSLFWSPHKLHRMTSTDGIQWGNHKVVMRLPYHRYFRDAMILQVAEDQWLMAATGRGSYFSRVDLYQSFDLEKWQYIGPALRSTFGSERNAIFASMESPTIISYKGRFYLAITYNNDSFFFTAIFLIFKKFLNRNSYNDTLIFGSDTPYSFGIYRGKKGSGSLVTNLECHAPEFIFQPESQAWYVTTAGWPWAAKLTGGEVAFAPLEWELKKPA
jgi:arabinan endo-1,5-alpha-L-arabinosidase